jgi:hypothetical protein
MPRPVVRRLPAARTAPDPSDLTTVPALRGPEPAPEAPSATRTAERARPRASWVLVADAGGRPRPQMRWTC